MKKYQEIYNDLKEKIRKNVYPAESSLPTEQQLQEIYGVSRDTVRKALAILTEGGLIQKVQGRGSMVLKQEILNFPVSGLTSYQELT
ncbi:GntR family transcriptional regulator, partial [Streptococcus suis]